MPKYTISQTVRIDYEVEAETAEAAWLEFQLQGAEEHDRDPVGDIEVSLDGKLLLPPSTMQSEIGKLPMPTTRAHAISELGRLGMLLRGDDSLDDNERADILERITAIEAKYLLS